MARIPYVSIVAAAAAVLRLAGAPASAAVQGADARWQPWLGCWAMAGGTQSVCVNPAAAPSAVDIVTTGADGVVTREHIIANGERQASERDNCTGWERAQWSADGRRVYLSSEYQCANGPTRNSSGLLAMSSRGRWLSIAGVTLGQNTGVRVLRYDAVDSTPSAGAARTAMASIDAAAIIETSSQADPVVVEAWLSASGEAFSTDARRLIQLANAKVPARVIDMLVALSYPRAFAVRPSPTTPGVLADDGVSGGGFDEFSAPASLADCRPSTASQRGDFGRLSLYGWDGCSMYYGYSRFAYSPFLASPYGQWYTGSGPQPIVIGVGASAHGTVTKGGYVEGNGGSTSGSTSASSGNGSGTPDSSGGTSTTSSSGDRTAHPR